MLPPSESPSNDFSPPSSPSQSDQTFHSNATSTPFDIPIHKKQHRRLFSLQPKHKKEHEAGPSDAEVDSIHSSIAATNKKSEASSTGSKSSWKQWLKFGSAAAKKEPFTPTLREVTSAREEDGRPEEEEEDWEKRLEERRDKREKRKMDLSRFRIDDKADYMLNLHIKRVEIQEEARRHDLALLALENPEYGDPPPPDYRTSRTFQHNKDGSWSKAIPNPSPVLHSRSELSTPEPPRHSPSSKNTTSTTDISPTAPPDGVGAERSKSVSPPNRKHEQVQSIDSSLSSPKSSRSISNEHQLAVNLYESDSRPPSLELDVFDSVELLLASKPKAPRSSKPSPPNINSHPQPHSPTTVFPTEDSYTLFDEPAKSSPRSPAVVVEAMSPPPVSPVSSGAGQRRPHPKTPKSITTTPTSSPPPPPPASLPGSPLVDEKKGTRRQTGERTTAHLQREGEKFINAIMEKGLMEGLEGDLDEEVVLSKKLGSVSSEVARLFDGERLLGVEKSKEDLEKWTRGTISAPPGGQDVKDAGLVESTKKEDVGSEEDVERPESPPDRRMADTPIIPDNYAELELRNPLFHASGETFLPLKSKDRLSREEKEWVEKSKVVPNKLRKGTRAGLPIGLPQSWGYTVLSPISSAASIATSISSKADSELSIASSHHQPRRSASPSLSNSSSLTSKSFDIRYSPHSSLGAVVATGSSGQPRSRPAALPPKTPNDNPSKSRETEPSPNKTQSSHRRSPSTSSSGTPLRIQPLTKEALASIDEASSTTSGSSGRTFFSITSSLSSPPAGPPPRPGNARASWLQDVTEWRLTPTPKREKHRDRKRVSSLFSRPTTGEVDAPVDRAATNSVPPVLATGACSPSEILSPTPIGHGELKLGAFDAPLIKSSLASTTSTTLLQSEAGLTSINPDSDIRRPERTSTCTEISPRATSEPTQQTASFYASMDALTMGSAESSQIQRVSAQTTTTGSASSPDASLQGGATRKDANPIVSEPDDPISPRSKNAMATISAMQNDDKTDEATLEITSAGTPTLLSFPTDKTCERLPKSAGVIRRMRQNSTPQPSLTEVEKFQKSERRKAGASEDFGKSPQETKYAHRHAMKKLHDEFVRERSLLESKISLQGTDTRTLNELAILHYRQPLESTRKEGARYWKESLDLDDQQAEVYHCLGTYYEHSGDHESALSLFRSAADLEPDSARHWLVLGSLANKVGNTREVVRIAGHALQRAASLAPHGVFGVEACYQLGLFYEFINPITEYQVAGTYYQSACDNYGSASKEAARTGYPLRPLEYIERRAEWAFARAAAQEQERNEVKEELKDDYAITTTESGSAIRDEHSSTEPDLKPRDSSTVCTHLAETLPKEPIAQVPRSPPQSNTASPHSPPKTMSPPPVNPPPHPHPVHGPDIPPGSRFLTNEQHPSFGEAAATLIASDIPGIARSPLRSPRANGEKGLMADLGTQTSPILNGYDFTPSFRSIDVQTSPRLFLQDLLDHLQPRLYQN
ncbi:hypothetical protein T439DRAFT_44719 [Meredithblackwellia eburnea MCA 4105]